MTVPAGVPAQARAASIEAYGGHSEKRNYQAQGVVNPLTDVDAAQLMRLTADLAACARVAPFCVLTVQCNDTAPAAPTVVRAQQMGITSVAGYEGDSPPDASLPTLSRDGDGAFTITWPATTTDDYGVSAAVDLAHITATAQGVLLPAVDAEILIDRKSADVVITTDGSAAADALVTIEVG